MRELERILIVEDDALTALAIEENLSAAGYIICSKAHDYKSALQIMKEEDPDLALVDIKLKNEPDGIETVKDLIQIKPIPIVYLTGNTESETFDRAKNTNPLGFLHKPFRPKELSHQLELAIYNFYRWKKDEIIKMPDHFYVPGGPGKLKRINFIDIYYLNASGAYSELYLRTGTKEVISVGLGKLIGHLPENFSKLSRSIVINSHYLKEIEHDKAVIGPLKIHLTETSRKILVERLTIVHSRSKSL